ncbi:glycoside hydrolase family 95 protein [Asticcacaulis sp. 201]|uniref:glycoside hydrolase family 95 protein n=1 Tax=Asticcacaulis sp. 201 TaxID=3028787 RepID=UPI002915ED3B|nr:glycoside hydrolase family 95 protein [Asticcacaulis sp. 201]MDV6331000.1 glycoside hydrolase family 95 protein [Asticcacaulis sp. 201]
MSRDNAGADMDRRPGHPSRRSVLAASTALALASTSGLAKTTVEKTRKNVLWYRQPARFWEEALPLGNGRLGAMVFGRVAQERIQINEDTLWSGAPYSADNPQAYGALPEVRQLIANGKYAAATDLASRKMMGQPLHQAAYGTLGDLLLTFDGASKPKHYERQLDLATAISTTRLSSGNGHDTVREAFVSAPDQVIVLRLDARECLIGFDLSWHGPRAVKVPGAVYGGHDEKLTPPVTTDWLMTEAIDPLPAGAATVADGAGALLCTGRNEAGESTPASMTFAMRVKVLSDGQVTVEEGRLKVRGAKTVTLLIAAATSFVTYADVSGDPVARVRQQTEAAGRKSYSALKQAHLADYQPLFQSVSLDLGPEAADLAPTDHWVQAAATTDDPGLQALYFQYARYLMISSSRPGTQAANLQGIWNESTTPPWGSKYTINVNTEMNYWPADPAGLGVCVGPLIRLVEELAVTGARTAKTMYGARGWVAHHNTDIWRATAPIDGPMWGLWPCGGAWLCNSLWDHYDYSRDDALPARLYPLMKGAALFCMDTLIEDPKGRGLITSPSVSPENQHPFGSSVCAGPAMDRQIIRDLFAHTLACGQLVRDEAGFLAQLKQRHDRLAPDRIGQGGQLQEWLEDWDGAAPEQQHRHVSHLYAVYPSDQINVRDTPNLIHAAQTSLAVRGDMATGWGTAWRLCLWARMGEGDHAYRVLKDLVGPQRTYPNLFDAHPPFQIDGNFGGAAGIMEMLLQSWGGEIRLLPALPSAWTSGEVRGLRARGALTVDLAWRAGVLTACQLKGRAGQAVRVIYRGTERTLTLGPDGTAVFKV